MSVEQQRRPEIPKMRPFLVIGGFGNRASYRFEGLLHYVSKKLIPQYQNQGFPPWVTCNFNITPMQINAKGIPQQPLTPDAEILRLMRSLGSFVDFGVVPTHTFHVPNFWAKVTEAFGKPMINMADLAIEEVKKRNSKKVGILAIGGTLRSRLYQGLLDGVSIPFVEIPDSYTDDIDSAIFATMEYRETEKHKQVLRNAVRHLREQGADCIILGCSEFPIILEDELNDRKTNPDLIDATLLLAEATIRRSITTTKESIPG